MKQVIWSLLCSQSLALVLASQKKKRNLITYLVPLVMLMVLTSTSKLTEAINCFSCKLVPFLRYSLGNNALHCAVKKVLHCQIMNRKCRNCTTAKIVKDGSTPYRDRYRLWFIVKVYGQINPNPKP